MAKKTTKTQPKSKRSTPTASASSWPSDDPHGPGPSAEVSEPGESRETSEPGPSRGN